VSDLTNSNFLTKRGERMHNARQKGTHTDQEWQEMLNFFNHTCVKCEGESGLTNVEKDHIKPVYQGGSDSIRNLQPLCARCNASEGPKVKDYRVEYCNRHDLAMPPEWERGQ